jgi:hypothetical protein
LREVEERTHLLKRLAASGAGRRRTEDRGKALAGKSTLNRLELTPKEAGKEDRYKKIAQTEAMDTLLVEVFVESHAVPPKEIVIDVDATDDPYTGIRKGVSFTGITATIVICRCISFAGIGCSARVCGRRRRNLPPGASRSFPGS